MLAVMLRPRSCWSSPKGTAVMAFAVVVLVAAMTTATASPYDDEDG